MLSLPNPLAQGNLQTLGKAPTPHDAVRSFYEGERAQPTLQPLEP